MKNKIASIAPFVSLIIFFTCWLVFDHFWLGFWCLWLNIAIPLLILFHPANVFRILYPLILILGYIILATLGLWDYAWIFLVFLPVFDMIYDKEITIVKTVNVCILIVYLILGFCFKYWNPGWIVFLFCPINYILFSDIDKKHHEEMILNNKNIHYHD
jgi:hypothetical protein